MAGRKRAGVLVRLAKQEFKQGLGGSIRGGPKRDAETRNENSVLKTPVLLRPQSTFEGVTSPLTAPPKRPIQKQAATHCTLLHPRCSSKERSTEINWLNFSLGALALKRHLMGISYKPVNNAKTYTALEPVLDEISAFGEETFAALGYVLSPSSSFSFANLVAIQKEFVPFALTLGHLERKV
eukprot:6191045-Pleurochrysis_carterae.AAC.4